MALPLSLFLASVLTTNVLPAAVPDSSRPLVTIRTASPMGDSGRTSVRDRMTVAPAVLYADSIVVEKGLRSLTLYHAGEPVKRYLVALGKEPVGDKVRQGDSRTPEGIFHIEGRNRNSQFFRSLRISYPSQRHLDQARELGVKPGGDIMLHGLPPQWSTLGSAHLQYDWTEGCIALTNSEIMEIWAAVPDGAPIEIKP
jgi:murein L,D-transpeptidase YafK